MKTRSARASAMPMFRAAPIPALAALASNFVGNQSVDAISCLTTSTDPSSEWSSTTMSSTAVPSELITDDMASVIGGMVVVRGEHHADLWPRLCPGLA